MRFIESILFENGKYYNLALHQKRINRTVEKFNPELKSLELRDVVPQAAYRGRFKVRVTYDISDEPISYDLEFVEYVPRAIASLELVDAEKFDYSFKYEDRDMLNALKEQSKADDIIITIHGLITDSSYANLAFWDGKKWLTPDAPLLDGVRRQQLIAANKIKEAPIRVADLGAFEKVSLINAMLDLEETMLTISQVLKR